MKKVLLLGALLLCVSQSALAKSKKDATAQEITDPKVKVESATKDLTDRMTSQLGGKKGKINEFKKNHKQFLFEESKIDNVLQTKSHNLDEIYNKLQKEFKPTEFIVDDNRITTGTAQPKIEYKQKKNRIDTIVKNEVIVPVHFQTRTIAKENVSDARYDVTMEWEVNPTKKNGKPKLISVKSTPIELTGSEKNQIQKLAKEAIIDWYKNLPSNLKKEYTVNATAPVSQMQVSAGSINLAGPITKRLTINNVPEISLQLNPLAFINQDSIAYYTNPTASMILKPEFEITIDNSLKKATVTDVRYKETLNTPVADAVKSARIRQASQTVSDLFNKLSVHIAQPTPDSKTNLESMFVSPEKTISISNLTKQGKETIGKRSAKAYLNRVRGSEMALTDISLLDEAKVSKLNRDYPELNIPFDNNFNLITFLVRQRYEGKNYKDNTSKIIMMENINGDYKVNQIAVIPGSTELLD